MPDVLTIQPCDIDTYLDSYYPDTNYGTYAYDLVYAGQGLQTRRSILKFDFSALPPGAVISAATLSLYYVATLDANPTGRTYWTYRVTQTAWTEAGATWNKYDGATNWATAGGDYTTDDGVSVVMPVAASVWIDWDVTTMVQYAQANLSEIIHFLLRDSNEAGSFVGAQFASREYATENLRPKLIITYTLPELGIFVPVIMEVRPL